MARSNLIFADIELEYISPITILSGLDETYIRYCIESLPHYIHVENHFSVFDIPNLTKKGDTIVILYPESGRTTLEQRDYIRLLHDEMSKLDLTVLVFTNSPFIINQCAQITEEQKEECFCNNREFEPLSKVYYLPNNKISTKKGEALLDSLGKKKGRYGYWGKKASLIATHLISQGLGLSNTARKEHITHTTPIVVICEGQDSNADSAMYNAIIPRFRDHSVLFVSSKGSSQAITSFELLRQLKGSIEAQFQVLMLRDRDHDFPNEVSVIKYEKNYKGRKVLRKRAIECYIYNEESAQLLLDTLSLTLSQKQKDKINRVQDQISKEVESQKLGHDYKIRLRKVFNSITSAYISHHKINTEDENAFILNHIVPLIHSKTKIYQELTEILFADLK